ncbi:DUF389 domain-containing protein [Schlesneria paludicola]|uniref:hypothetical protein n=1 Tax=Schlesneria paludicola TaxID=360056 RepID=UPI00058FC466|nr:hypothetical protein [Schlesneria paludicola]
MSFLDSLSSKRSLAVALWVLTAGWLALASSSLPENSSFSLVLLVATACSLGLLLAIDGSLAGAQPQNTNRWVSLMASLGVALFGGIIAGQSSSTAEMAVLVAVAILPVVVTWIVATWRRSHGVQAAPSQVSGESTVNLRPPRAAAHMDGNDHLFDQSESVLEEESESILGFEPIDFDSPSAAEMTQWHTRSRRETGETIEGGIRIEFAEGQREVTVHISFCPPLARCPELMAEDLDGADLEIRVAASYPFGARLTVRRPLRSSQRAQRSPSESCRIGFVAISESIQRAA